MKMIILLCAKKVAKKSKRGKIIRNFQEMMFPKRKDEKYFTHKETKNPRKQFRTKK